MGIQVVVAPDEKENVSKNGEKYTED